MVRRVLLQPLCRLPLYPLETAGVALAYCTRITKGAASGEDTRGAATVDAVAAVVSVVLIVIIVADAAETVRPQH